MTKYTLTTINARCEAAQSVMAAKLTRLTHKIAIQLHLVAESCTIFSSRSSWPVRKLLDTLSYILIIFLFLSVAITVALNNPRFSRTFLEPLNAYRLLTGYYVAGSCGVPDDSDHVSSVCHVIRQESKGARHRIAVGL
jgi:hypothetical protein